MKQADDPHNEGEAEADGNVLGIRCRS
jgi:hypothetical protein